MKLRKCICLLMLVCLLTGCNDPVGKTVAYGDLQLTLPGDFIELSGESYAEDADFMYGRKTLVVKGLSEKKSDLQEMTLTQYTSYVISGNQLSCTPEIYGDGFRFTYDATIGDTVYTYTTATIETPTCFWILQFYCPKENLAENQPEIQVILEGLQVAKD